MFVVCPECSGLGEIWFHNPETDEEELISCKACGGAGHVHECWLEDSDDRPRPVQREF